MKMQVEDDGTDATRVFYDKAYAEMGFAAQRLYPNEELLRFMGTYYFGLPKPERKPLRFLELGCGSCPNLWMIGREGFAAHGLDLSNESLVLGQQMLTHWGTSAELTCGSMTDIAYPDSHFDAVIDVFSSNCLPEKAFATCLDEVARVLKPGGRYFSYTPSKNSDGFRNPAPAIFIDPSTLNGIYRTTAPFFGQDYPFRFITENEYQALLMARGFEVNRCERIGRTYRNGEEYFEFISLHAHKAHG